MRTNTAGRQGAAFRQSCEQAKPNRLLPFGKKTDEARCETSNYPTASGSNRQIE